MAHIATRSQAPGAKSVPAELRAAPWQGTPDFALARLHQNLEQSQARGGVIPPGLQRHFAGGGMSGLGDTCYDTESGSPYACDSSGNPTFSTTLPTPTVVPANSPSFNWGGLTSAINASSTDIAKILAASNPGTYYKDPSGNIIYSQPTGNTQNLLGVGSGGYPVGSITSPFGSASIAGISPTTLMMIAAVGLMFMMMGRK